MAKLTDINKNNSFGVPEDYFESLTDQIQSRISEEKLKEDYGNKNPFTVPKNYFKNFNPKKDINKSIGVIQMLKPYLSIAAGIILVLVIWQITLSVLDNKNAITELNDSALNDQNIQYAEIFDFSDVSIAEIEVQLTDYIDDTDVNSLIAYTNEEFDQQTNNTEQEAAYEYFIDYSDDYSDYEEILAQI